MRADRFTLKAQEALAAAQRLAQARRNPEVAPHHLLVALLEQGGGADGGAGIVVPVLRRAKRRPGCGAPARQRGARRRAHGQRRRAERPVAGLRPYLPAGAAENEARGLGDEYVSTEHLLLALAADPQVDAGASRDKLPEAVEAARGPHRVTDQSPERD